MKEVRISASSCFYNFLCKQYLTYRMMSGQMRTLRSSPAANARFHFLKPYFKSQIWVARWLDSMSGIMTKTFRLVGWEIIQIHIDSQSVRRHFYIIIHFKTNQISENWWKQHSKEFLQLLYVLFCTMTWVWKSKALNMAESSRIYKKQRMA